MREDKIAFYKAIQEYRQKYDVDMKLEEKGQILTIYPVKDDIIFKPIGKMQLEIIGTKKDTQGNNVNLQEYVYKLTGNIKKEPIIEERK